MKKAFSFVEAIYLLVIIVAIFIGGVKFVAKPIAKTCNPREHVILVTDKKVKNDTYLIYGETEDGETMVFEITDSVFKWRFDSSDRYACIKESHTYRFQTCGYRKPFFSMYPNIYEIEELEE